MAEEKKYTAKEAGIAVIKKFTELLIKAEKEHKHIGWAKLHGKLERESYSKESSDKIAGAIKAKVHPEMKKEDEMGMAYSEKGKKDLKKEDSQPSSNDLGQTATAGGTGTINSQIGNPFGKSDMGHEWESKRVALRDAKVAAEHKKKAAHAKLIEPMSLKQYTDHIHGKKYSDYTVPKSGKHEQNLKDFHVAHEEHKGALKAYNDHIASDSSGMHKSEVNLDKKEDDDLDEKENAKSGKKVEPVIKDNANAKPAIAPAPVPAAAPAAQVAAAPAVPAPAPAAAAPDKTPSTGNTTSPTKTNTETGGSSPGGASTGGVGSGIGGAGTGGAATGGASTGGAGTVNLTISGNSGTGSNGEGKSAPITINISHIGGKTDAGNVASGDGPGAGGKGGSGEGSGGGGGGAAPDEPENFSTSGKDSKEKPSAKNEKMKKSENTMNKMYNKNNPDEKEDAELGEKVENDVEQHMEENKEAEQQEGHKMLPKDDHIKGHFKLAKFMGHVEGKKSAKVMPDSGNNDPVEKINYKPSDMDKAETGHEKGINTSTDPSQKSRVMMGTSKAGSTLPGHANDPKQKIADEAEAKDKHRQVLGEMKQMSKPKLPK